MTSQNTHTRVILSITLIALLLPSMAIAQSLLPEHSQVQIRELANLIRWSGIVTSLLIIATALFLLKVIHSVVHHVSSEFAQRRLTLQKIETFVKFIICVLTTIIVFNLSLRIDERVLAFTGGALAVSVGFAMKDLVASIISDIMIMLERPLQVGNRLNFGGE